MTFARTWFSRFYFRALIYLGLCLAAFHRFAAETIIQRDAMRYYAPYKFMLAKALRAGEIWAWQPWEFLGLPFIAEIQSSWFYPLNIFYAALPFWFAHNLYILSHFFIAACAMDLFLRGRGLGAASAFFGALVLAFSGHLVSQHGQVTVLIGAALAPLALYLFDRALSAARTRVWLFTAWAGAVIALQILAGDPQGAAVTGFIIAGWGAVAAIREGKPKPMMASAAVAGSAALLSAVQLLPTMELMALTNRAAGLSLAECQRFFFHPARLLEIVWPLPFGAQWPEWSFWGQEFLLGDLKEPMAWSVSNYLGIPAAALAVYGAVSGRFRWRFVILAVLALALLLSLGPYAPVFEWCHRFVPLFSAFRYPEKYMAWFTGAAAVLAAIGLDHIEREGLPPKLFWVTAAAAASALLAAVWWRLPGFAQSVIGGGNQELYGLAMSGLKSGGVWIVAVTATAIIIALAATKLRRDFLFILFMALILTDLFTINVSGMPSGSRDIYRIRPAALDAMLERAGNQPFRVDRLEIPEPPPAPGDYIERQRRWEIATMNPNLHYLAPVQMFSGYNVITFADDYYLFANIDPDLLSLYNTRFLITAIGGDPFPGHGLRAIYADEENRFQVLELPDPLPRAYLPRWVEPAGEGPVLLERLRRASRERGALIEGAKTGTFAGGEARVVEYSPERVTVEIEAKGPGWLVLSDRFYPGWTASVNGRRVEISRANLSVRAAPVPAGRSLVEFSYQSRPLMTGAIISAASWLALLALMVTNAAREKRLRRAGGC